MRDGIRRVLAGQEAYVVGGAIRDERLGRPVVDVDIACHDPAAAARAYREQVDGALFPLSERHGAWRVAVGGEATVDFTPLRGTIHDDLGARDFTVNAIARPLNGDELVDPFAGVTDLEAGTLRAVSETVFHDDPLRLLRAVRLEDELGLRLEPRTEALVRRDATLVGRPAGERILGELTRLSRRGWLRLEALGLLGQLGGTSERVERLPEDAPATLLLVAALGRSLERLPISNEQRRLARTLLTARLPADTSPRELHRFLRRTGPWALEALLFLGAPELVPAVETARAAEPTEPLLRGDELGLPPGPLIGQVLTAVAEERAAGTISTREEALALAARLAEETEEG
ncbi:MAG: CCA tRNA nucleotidyltransferase [Thermoleophilia bacterium]|nr:CCA tRNA nucleotidyltransferase [Thermoleophilia bacterium]